MFKKKDALLYAIYCRKGRVFPVVRQKIQDGAQAHGQKSLAIKSTLVKI
jgi:hypothetical protein